MLKAPNVTRSLAHAVTCRELLWELSPWFNKVLTVQPPGPRVHTHVHTRAHPLRRRVSTSVGAAPSQCEAGGFAPRHSVWQLPLWGQTERKST